MSLYSGEVQDLTNPYTGLFTRYGRIANRPHDPAVAMVAGTLAPFGPRAQGTEVGGAGWSVEQAHLACLGEAIERIQAYAQPGDAYVETSFSAWALDEPAIDPERWVLFHTQQYQLTGFPFRPFTHERVCRWVPCRQLDTGDAKWVPEESAVLYSREGATHQLTPSISTGLSSGFVGDPVILRGVQEVIERDAIIGGWWGRYGLEAWPVEEVFARLGKSCAERCMRGNLTYRFYRVDSPYSGCVTVTTLEGEDREGWLFSAGAACREGLESSFRKSLLEAIQGRHFVRYLRDQRGGEDPEGGADSEVRSFADHALYFSLHRERLDNTVLRRGLQPPSLCWGGNEGLSALCERLGPQRPVLFRLLTPPVAAASGKWVVVKVIVPGLQPMHGHHGLPHLGGALWAPRDLAAWAQMEPHPFP